MQRIVVGVDGSEASQLALQWAVNEGRLRNATVTAVLACEASYTGVGFPFAPGVVPPDVFESDGTATLEAAVNAVDASEVDLDKTVVWGGAAESLIAAAKGADLLVVGSRGRGGFTGLLLGSVGHQVAHHAPCPVVIVPPTD
jgi:nucleotide-binding universal stress UspA family protein